MKISKFASWAKHDNQTFIINSETQKCVVLDEIGEEIWESLIKTQSLNQTIDNLVNKYSNNDSAAIQKDIVDMFNIFVENDLIIES